MRKGTLLDRWSYAGKACSNLPHTDTAIPQDGCKEKPNVRANTPFTTSQRQANAQPTHRSCISSASYQYKAGSGATPMYAEPPRLIPKCLIPQVTPQLRLAANPSVSTHQPLAPHAC